MTRAFPLTAALAISILALAPLWSLAQKPAPPGRSAAPPPSASASAPSASAAPKNALQLEMITLTAAMQEVVVALANNQLSTIRPAIHRIHLAREQTEAALDQGLIKLPRNPDKLAEFKKEDAAFHDELVKLLKAAQANDLTAATRQTGVILDGCTRCHLSYRF